MYNHAVPTVWSLVIVNVIATGCLKLMNTDSIITFSRPLCWNVDKFYLFIVIIQFFTKLSRNSRPTVGNRWFYRLLELL
jgi:hypothetical protein